MNGRLSPGTEAPVFEKWRYLTFAAADMGYALMYFWVVSFLTIFYTDVFGIPVLTVSVMMLITRIYDAVNDPIIGSLLDNHRGKFGRYRPWIVIGGLGMVVTTIFLFWAHPGWGSTGKVVYMYTTYILCTTAMTVFYMAYGALGGTISSNSTVRMKANSARFALSGVGTLVIGYFVPTLLERFSKESASRGYLLGIAVSAAIAVPLLLITGAGTKEVVYPKDAVKYPLKAQLTALSRNRPMLFITALFLIQGASMTFRMTSATYYFTYIAGSLSYFSLYNLLLSLFSILGALTAQYIYKFVRDKAKALIAVLAVTIASLIGMYILPAPGKAFFVLAALSGYSNGAIPALSYSMLPEAVDYTQYKEDMRLDAFMSAVGSFAFKCGMAVAGALVGILLSASGYVSNVQQTPGALSSINIMMTLIPAVLLLVMAILMFFYPLSEEKHSSILLALQKRGDL